MPYMRVKRKMAISPYPDLSMQQPELVMARGGKVSLSNVPVYDIKLIRNKANDIYGVNKITSSMDVKTVMDEISRAKNYQPYAVTLLLSNNNVIQDVIEHDKDIYGDTNERKIYLEKVMCAVPAGAIICIYDEDISYNSSKIGFVKKYFELISVKLLDVALSDGINYISEADNGNLAHGGKIGEEIVNYPDLSKIPPNMVMDDVTFTKLDRLEMVKVDDIDISSITDSLIIERHKTAADIMFYYWDKNKISAVEQLAVMYLDKKGKLLGMYTHSWGGRTATILEPTIIIASAINLKANALIICHNHPSGNLKPSGADIRVANELYAALYEIDMKLIDSLILVPEANKFTSMSLEGHVMFAKGGKIAYKRLVKKMAYKHKQKATSRTKKK